MSFLKDFRDELSQAVNELVSEDDKATEISQNDKDVTEKNEEDNKNMSRQNRKSKENRKKQSTQKNVTESNEYMDNSNTNKDSVSEDEMVNTFDTGNDNMDMKILNELFGNNQSKENDVEIEDNSESIHNDYEKSALPTETVENLNEFDKAVDEKVQEQKDNINEVIDSEIYKEPEDDIIEDSKENKEEVMNEDDVEMKKEALRGNSGLYSESYTHEDEKKGTLVSEEVAEVTKGMMIEGNIISDGSVNVYGKIKGNVACHGKLMVCGTIVGASRGAEIFTNNARINGDITSDGSIKVGNGSVVIGNVYGTSAVIAGAVKGDIDVHGPVVVDGTAVVQGNIRSRSVQINNGAAIEGQISQCYAEIDYTALFDKTFSK